MVELGLIDAAEHDEIVLAEYEGYARNALVQLRRIREGTQIEEDHMRNRQMIVQWLLANSSAIEVRRRDGKTYYAMVDAVAFQEASGRLLAEVQRIKAEGDYPAAKALFETYGVHFEPALRDEVVARVEHLNMPSYTGFVQPRLEPVTRAERRDHGCDDLVSAGSDDADAGVFGQKKMKRAAVAATAVLVACLQPSRARHRDPARRASHRTPRVVGADGVSSTILAAEDSRLPASRRSSYAGNRYAPREADGGSSSALGVRAIEGQSDASPGHPRARQTRAPRGHPRTAPISHTGTHEETAQRDRPSVPRVCAAR